MNSAVGEGTYWRGTLAPAAAPDSSISEFQRPCIALRRIWPAASRPRQTPLHNFRAWRIVNGTRHANPARRYTIDLSCGRPAPSEISGTALPLVRDPPGLRSYRRKIRLCPGRAISISSPQTSLRREHPCRYASSSLGASGISSSAGCAV